MTPVRPSSGPAPSRRFVETVRLMATKVSERREATAARKVPVRPPRPRAH